MVEWKNHLITLSLLTATIVGIALWETNTLSHWGKIGIVLSIFLAPSFLYRAYRMWERREHLKEIYEMSKSSMTAIKSIQKNKEENKKRQEE